MSYDVVAGNSVVYELLLSFLLYKRRANLKYLDKGIDWIQEVHEQITPAFEKELEQLADSEFGDAVCLLIENCPDNRQATSFLKWLQALSGAQMYAVLAPHLRQKNSHILLDLEYQRDQFVYYLKRWNEQYFQKQAIEEVFNKAIKDLEKTIRNKTEPTQIVENFATGLSIEMDDIRQVVMIPSVHFSPLHTFDFFNQKMFLWYPLKLNSSDFEDILRMGKCLSDRKRLEILQFLSTGKYTFTDVFKRIGGAKGNTHHHLMTLRAAGLVRIQIGGDGQVFYASTRKAFVAELKDKLDGLIQSE